MKPCSNPTCPYQVEDDARFCGMCGAYVGPEMTSQATLIDASTQRIQQCRDLLNSLQSEPDEKEKAQKIRTVINIVTSINTNQLPGKPIALVAEQLQVLSAVVQEMIALPSISPTASTADMQRWPISLLEMRQWTARLIALNGGNKFSSLDKATKSAVRVALGRFISFIGIHARSNPDAEQFLLDLYESIIAVSVPELQSCFLGINKSKLLRRLGQRMQSSLSSTTPNVSPDEVRAFGALAAEGLSVSELGSEDLKNSTDATLEALRQVAILGETQRALASAAVDAYVAFLQSKDNPLIYEWRSLVRMDTIRELAYAVYTSAVQHHQHIEPDTLTVLGEALPQLIAHPDEYSVGVAETVRRYIRALDAISGDEPDRKEEIAMKLRELLAHSGGRLNKLDRSLVKEADRLLFRS